MIALKDIKHPGFVTKDKHYAALCFLGALVVDRGIIQNKKKLFYSPLDKQSESVFRVLDEKRYERYKHKNFKDLLFKFDSGIVKEFFGTTSFNLVLPIEENGKDITQWLFEKYISELVKGQAIDDLHYNLLRAVFRTAGVFYNSETNTIGVGTKMSNKKIVVFGKHTQGKVTDYNLEEVLGAEVAQGYINKDIGDPNRDYGYTHLLRQHAEFRLTNWAKTLLINWKKYNVLGTSRGQGKCEYIESINLLSNGERKKAKDLKVGDKLMGSNYKEQEVVGIEYGKKQLVRVTLDNGMSKIVTFDHRIPTSKNFRNGLWDEIDFNYSEAVNLNLGDKIPVAYNYETNGNDFTEENILLYGYFLGDGTVGNNTIHGNHNRLLDIIKNYKISVNKQKGCNKYTIHGFKQNNIFEGYDLISNKKFIDSRIFSQKKELKFKLLEGLFNTDSYLRKSDNCLEYCSTSEELVNGILDILYSLGIVCIKKRKKIKSNFKTNNEFAYYIYLNNKEDLKYLLSNIDLSCKKNYEDFLIRINEIKNINNNIGTIPLEAFNEKTVKGECIKGQMFYGGIRKPKYDFQRWKLKNYGIENWGKYSWHKVINIEILEEDDIVSVQVSNNDSLYFINGILSHNTFLAALIATRGLLDSRPGFGGRKYREIKYFVPDKENIGTQVMQYITSLIGDLKTKKLDNGKKAFEFGNYSIKCNITGNYFNIVSLYNFGNNAELGTSLGEGLACDLAIIDEAARIPNDFWISFHQRAVFETQEFFLCSTINQETPVDHWFYKLIINGETGNDDVNAYRITIDQNEIMKYGKTEEERSTQLEIAKSELRIKGDREFYSKGYCIILEESNVFQLGGVIISDGSYKYSNDDPRILGFDLGKLDDTAGLSIINLKYRTIESSIKVNNLTYGMQLQYAKEYKERFKNILVIGDRSGVGEAVSEQDTDGIVDVWIKSTGQGELNFNKKYKFYTCNKGFIITTLATVFSNNIIKIPNTNIDLIDQLNNFVKMKSGRGEVILYKGKGKKKDDLVLSTAYGILYMYAILGLKTKEDIEFYVNEIGNNSTYIYNDYGSMNNSYYGGLY